MWHVALSLGPQKGIGCAASQFPSERWRTDSACGAVDVSVWLGFIFEFQAAAELVFQAVAAVINYFELILLFYLLIYFGETW